MVTTHVLAALAVASSGAWNPSLRLAPLEILVHKLDIIKFVLFHDLLDSYQFLFFSFRFEVVGGNFLPLIPLIPLMTYNLSMVHTHISIYINSKRVCNKYSIYGTYQWSSMVINVYMRYPLNFLLHTMTKIRQKLHLLITVCRSYRCRGHFRS